MWTSNVNVTQTYTSHHSQNSWAILSGGGLSGWKQIRPNAADGVTNVFMILCAALANGRKIDVFIVSDQIERAVLK